MSDSTAKGVTIRQFWPKPTSRVGGIGLWISVAAIVCLTLGLALGKGAVGGFFLGWSIFLLLLDVPFLLILFLRVLNRRLLWTVRNRLILTYLLMGLTPVVLFGTLAAIAGYVVAGQYAINTALAAMDEASGQIKGQSASLADIIASREMQPKDKPLAFEENSNPREAQISQVLLQNGVWQDLPIVTRRGKTPASPFTGQAVPAWVAPNFHGVVVLNGKLYLCYVSKTTEGTHSAEVLSSLELNHATLESMATSLGRVLMFSGFSKLHSGSIDGAEKEAETAENEAETAENAREAQRDAQETQRDALRNAQQAQRDAQQQAREAQGNLREAQRDAQEGISEAQRDLAQEQRNAAQALQSGHGDADDEKEAQQGIHEAQQGLQRAQEEAQKEIQAAQKNVPTAPPVVPPPPPVPQPMPPKPRGAFKQHAQISLGSKPSGSATQPAVAAKSAGEGGKGNSEFFTAVSGGVLPVMASFLDTRVYFTAPLSFSTWPGDAQTHSAMLVVISRPSALYTRLFSTSVDIGSILRNLLVVMAIFFGLLELLALWMATRLSRTITRSVAGLYAGTTEIDKGNLAYRVKPDRPDQLGALAVSFNTMAGSIQDLLVQQREKERLLSELAIAQEVQRNLFPQSPAFVTGLELHAVCVPARSVSGDYFDFIFGSSSTSRAGTTTCIALGDISGKGISAALLMASLHSAVRAFSLGEEDLMSPARLLDLLNRHLYRSTTPEKYATLFLAFYDSSTRRLTYANGGHLPPLILAADGSVQRLEAGGSVVGLLDGLTYGEATVQLQPGDLLVAYSDGLTEPEQETVEFGEARLLEFLLAHRSEPLPAITEETFRTLTEWIGTHEQPDDMTLLLARQL